jgi:plastocyanin domain-containing protein
VNRRIRQISSLVRRHGGHALALALGLASGSAALSCAPRPLGANEYAIHVTEQGFEPAELAVPRGQAVTLVITRDVESTCATEMHFAGAEQRWRLPLHQQVRIPLPDGVEDTLRYSCGMDMYEAWIVAK